MAASVMCFQVVLTYKTKSITNKEQVYGARCACNMLITLSPIIFIKCMLVDIVYTVTVVVGEVVVFPINLFKKKKISVRNFLDAIFSNIMDMDGANVEGIRRLRVVS